MTIQTIVQGLIQTTQKNAPVLLAASAIVGTVTTAALAGKGAYKAAKVLDGFDMVDMEPKERFVEQVRQTWKLYIPAVASCGITIGAITLGHTITTRRAAAYMSLYTLSEKALTEYKAKVVEQIGASKEEKIRESLAQDRTDEAAAKNPIVVVGSGKTVCVDAFSGRTFEARIEDVKAGINEFNAEVLRDGYGSLNRLYYYIGLEDTAQGDTVGWTSDMILEPLYTATLIKGSQPAFEIEFRNNPKPRFNYFG